MESLFEYRIETDKLHLKYARGEPSVRNREFHNYHEFVLFIRGTNQLISKNIQTQLTRGSLVIIPKEHFHHFIVEAPETYERLILGFYDTPELSRLAGEVMDTIKVIPDPSETVAAVFDELIGIVTGRLCDEDKALFTYSALIRLLIHLKQPSADVISKNSNLSPEVSRALAIIDERYSENLTIKSIADMLFVSPSTLAHKFSKELNISLYRYITKKRLMEAHKLIQNNESLSSAAAKSGFSDYSCFYRLYKKYE